MATLNPVTVSRSVDTDWSMTRGVHAFAGRITGGGAHAVTIETKLGFILFAACINETTANTALAITVASSSTYTGTKTVAFTVANAQTYSYLVIGVLGGYGRTPTIDSTGGATTVIYEPMKRN